jgi:hypothetical protein
MTKYTNLPYLKAPESHIQVQLSDVLLVASGTLATVYLYNPATKELTLLPVTTTTGSSDIAHTKNKLWLYGSYNRLTFSLNISEYDITLYPFSAVFKKEFALSPFSAGLCAISDTEIIAVRSTGEVYIVDISGEEPVLDLKFTIPSGRLITGDYMLTTTGKFIATTQDSTKRYISQWDMETGNLEMELDITESVELAFGLFEYENQIFIVSDVDAIPNKTKIYTIDKDPPYAITECDTYDMWFYGASQIPEQITVSFTPQT